MRTGDTAGIARRMASLRARGFDRGRRRAPPARGPDTHDRPDCGAYFIQESTTSALSFTHWTA